MHDCDKIATDAGQSVTSTLTTEAFGVVASQSGASANPYRFAGAWGYRDDGDAGLLHVGARYYDPQVGRFISRDPVLSEHPYLYCEHEPVNSVDPSGRIKFVIEEITVELGPIKIPDVRVEPPITIELPQLPPWLRRVGKAGAGALAFWLGWEVGEYISDNYIPPEGYQQAGDWLYHLCPGFWHMLD